MMYRTAAVCLVLVCIAHGDNALAQSGGPGRPGDDISRLAIKARDADLGGRWADLMDAYDALEALSRDPAHTAWAEYYLGYVDWRASSLAFMTEGLAGSGAMQGRAVAHFDRALAVAPDWVEARLLRVMAQAGVAASDPAKGPALYPAISAEMARVVKEAPNNPRVRLIAAMLSTFGAMRAPERVPGAIATWRSAAEAFAASPASPIEPAWGPAEAWGWLGGVQLAIGDAGAALISFDRALAVRPDFWWVREVARPQAVRPRDPRR